MYSKLGLKDSTTDKKSEIEKLIKENNLYKLKNKGYPMYFAGTNYYTNTFGHVYWVTRYSISRVKWH